MDRDKRTRVLAALCLAILAGVAVFTNSNQQEEPEPSPPAAAVAPRAIEAHLVPRSGGWKRVRATHLEQHPGCEVCGETENVEVHHYDPFHLFPEKELDPTNLVTLCGHGSRWNHHLWLGHLGDYKCYNRDLRAWVKAIKERKRE